MRFIAKGPVKIVEQANREKLLLESGSHGAISIDRHAMKFALSQGLATHMNKRLSINDAGRAWLRRRECPNDPFARMRPANRCLATMHSRRASGCGPISQWAT
ncbi:hypothetical protein [Phyllobacterium zundukense]|uniref:hypothetical protein n=1 Tax=Phyllobacterium zundukense TaxID=1867719 RepID=UPI001054DC27|nr:hypothetical protein [Phyllobacterium zundukense]